MNVAEVCCVLEELYPLSLAESWDYPGLIVGDPAWEVSSIALIVDPTYEAVRQAIDAGASMIISHHPLLFRAVHSLSATGSQGAVAQLLVESHTALWVGHTNADASIRGVGQAAADLFGLSNQRPLVPASASAAVPEGMDRSQLGLGRVGELTEPVSLREFAYRVARVLPHTNRGVNIAGDLDSLVRTVAVLPGSGDSLFDEVRAQSVDVYVTSDLRHHPATDALELARQQLRLQLALGQKEEIRLRPALIDTPHSAIESLWFHYAIEDIPAALEAHYNQQVRVFLGNIATDPWNLHIS